MAYAMSTMARRGGALSFNFPGDMYGGIARYGQTSGSIQGWREWRYGYYATSNGKPTWHNMGLNRSYHTSTASGSISTPWFNARGECHPNPSNGNLLRWRAPRAGKVRMLGQLMDANRAGGDSVDYWVAKMNGLDGYVTGNAVRQWIQKPTTGGNAGTYFNVGNISVNRGDCFYMVVGPRGNSSYDTTMIKWTIYYESCTDLDGLNLSLRGQIEDMGKYSAIMPEYYANAGNRKWQFHGQNASYYGKYTDKGTITHPKNHGISITSFYNSTIVPVVHRSSTTRDTHWYASVGNGTLNVDMIHGPNGAQWWGNATVKSSTMYLYNHAPPAIKKWKTGHTEASKNSGTNVAAAFSGLVGGLYGVGTVVKWSVNGRTYDWSFTDGYSTIASASVSFVNRGLTAYTYANK